MIHPETRSKFTWPVLISFGWRGYTATPPAAELGAKPWSSIITLHVYVLIAWLEYKERFNIKNLMAQWLFNVMWFCYITITNACYFEEGTYGLWMHFYLSSILFLRYLGFMYNVYHNVSLSRKFILCFSIILSFQS